MQPVKFTEMNCTLAEDQPEYRPLPAYQDNLVTVSRWQLGILERLRMLFTGRLWLMQMNFGDPLQPQLPSLRSPFATEAEEPRSRLIVT
jgi:hypothetical protein